MNDEGLTRRQRTILPLLLTMPVERACEQAKIRKPTVYKWLKQDAFKSELKRVQDEIFADALGRIKSNVGKAVDKLVTLLNSNNEQISVRACEQIIEYSIRLHWNEILESRIAALEERLMSGEIRPRWQQ